MSKTSKTWLAVAVVLLLGFAVNVTGNWGKIAQRIYPQYVLSPVPAEGLMKTSFHGSPNLRAVPLSKREPPRNSRDREEIELDANVGGTFTFALQTNVKNPDCTSGSAPYDLPNPDREWKTGLKLGKIADSMGDGTALGSQRMPDCVRLTITRLEDGATQTQDFHFDTLP